MITVGQLMNRELVTAPGTMSAVDAAKLMSRRKIGSLFVEHDHPHRRHCDGIGYRQEGGGSRSRIIPLPHCNNHERTGDRHRRTTADYGSGRPDAAPWHQALDGVQGHQRSRRAFRSRPTEAGVNR
ncbi:MAG: CBS domain-containing protein [Nitrospira sp.]|nr:CBS domain-containing protein [Nitrospira sp.]